MCGCLHKYIHNYLSNAFLKRNVGMLQLQDTLNKGRDVSDMWINTQVWEVGCKCVCMCTSECVFKFEYLYACVLIVTRSKGQVSFRFTLNFHLLANGITKYMKTIPEFLN